MQDVAFVPLNAAGLRAETWLAWLSSFMTPQLEHLVEAARRQCRHTDLPSVEDGKP
jgi:hypothetical protein